MKNCKFKEVVWLLKEYKEQYGDCAVPAKYITKNGVRLGIIVSNIRTGRRKINEEQKATLNNLGFVWNVQLSFEETLRLLKEYKEQNGDCLVPRAYVTEDGVRLGNIVSGIRCGARRTNADEKARLDSIGFVWRAPNNPHSIDFAKVIELLNVYKEQNGDCLVPQSYVTEDGIRLGNMVNSIRYGGRKTTASEKEILNGIGFAWTVPKNNPRSVKFEKVIELLKVYKEQYGDCIVPRTYVTEDGVRLGDIVGSIRRGSRKTTVAEKEILNDMGFVWKVPNNNSRSVKFEKVIELLKVYKEQNGDCLVPQSYVTEDGVRLGFVVASIRCGNRRTTEDEKAMLNSLGFVWKIQVRIPFEEVIRLLQKYKEQNGDYLVPHLYVTEDGVRLGAIVSNIRCGERKTNADEKALLNSLGFVWRVRKN